MLIRFRGTRVIDKGSAKFASVEFQMLLMTINNCLGFTLRSIFFIQQNVKKLLYNYLVILREPKVNSCGRAGTGTTSIKYKFLRTLHEDLHMNKAKSLEYCSTTFQEYPFIGKNEVEYHQADLTNFFCSCERKISTKCTCKFLQRLSSIT